MTHPSRRPATDASVLDLPTAESTFRTVNGIDLHVVAAGDEDDPLVVLLHGYPEGWYGWHRQLPALVEAGYRVVVPDQRGYNLSEKPEGVGAYRISNLSGDVTGLMATEGRESAHVVGHDWGAAVAWDLALRHPDVVDRLGIVNVPHPTVFRETLTSSLRQLRKSWYMFFYQLPRVPEWSMRRNDFAFMASALRNAEPGTFTEADLDRYRAAWSREGALTGMINWYRALFRHPVEPPRERVGAPTLVLWGEADEFLLPEMVEESLAYCEDGRLEWYPNASHWVLHERPDAVSADFLEHFES